MDRVYSLTKNDLTGVGGPMGTDSVRTEWREYFTSIQFAKEVAEEDHQKGDARENIRWKKDGNGLYSGDLQSHDYYIAPVVITK